MVCRIVIMASGNGSNFQALIDAVQAQRISDSQIVRLFVNRNKAYAVTRAENAGIPCTYFNLISRGFQAKDEKDADKLKEARSRYDAALAEVVLQDTPDLLICAGWMHVFTSSFLQPMRVNHVPVINLHPALPGMYDGTNAIERAFRDFQEGKLENNRTGLMIHYVLEEVDRGEPILIQELECRKDEGLHQFQERFHVQEHELIVNATAKIVRMLKGKECKSPDDND